MKPFHTLGASASKSCGILLFNRLPNFCQPFAQPTQRMITTAGGLGDGGEGFLVQPAANHLPLGIAHEIILPGRRQGAQFRARGRSDANGLNRHAFLDQCLSFLHAALFQVFAVRQQHDPLA